MEHAPLAGSDLAPIMPVSGFVVWRLTSAFARVVDEVVAAAGLILVCLTLGDAVASFWSDTILIYPAVLERICGVVLLPTWIWLLVTVFFVLGSNRDRFRASPQELFGGRRGWLGYAGGFVAIAIVLMVGFALGADKGSLRTLPSGLHQVSTFRLNNGAWTTVTTSDYHLWAARFIREEAALAFFGLFLVGIRPVVQYMRRVLGQ
jgi:hypothetical protein